MEDKGLVRYKDLLNKMAANALRYRRSLSNLNMKLGNDVNYVLHVAKYCRPVEKFAVQHSLGRTQLRTVSKMTASGEWPFCVKRMTHVSRCWRRDVMSRALHIHT